MIKGGGGEFERHPGKAVELYGYGPAGDFDLTMAAALEIAPRRMREDDAQPGVEALRDIWSGAVDDPFARGVILATAGAALLVAGAGDLDAAEAEAARLWSER